jgi:hypothetical protein
MIPDPSRPDGPLEAPDPTQTDSEASEAEHIEEDGEPLGGNFA